ncbi:MAG: hypothetical protein PHZ27_05550, partial [Candidatus Omnitrophica bacterium]|nr:hypothetical protein [Candidatus Omnitrophota bacterium]
LLTLADYAFALSVNFQDAGLAVNANINFIKTVSLEDKEIYAESKLISRTRKLGTYQINVLNKANVILAQAMSIAYFKD